MGHLKRFLRRLINVNATGSRGGRTRTRDRSHLVCSKTSIASRTVGCEARRSARSRWVSSADEEAGGTGMHGRFAGSTTLDGTDVCGASVATPSGRHGPLPRVARDRLGLNAAVFSVAIGCCSDLCHIRPPRNCPFFPPRVARHRPEWADIRRVHDLRDATAFRESAAFHDRHAGVAGAVLTRSTSWSPVSPATCSRRSACTRMLRRPFRPEEMAAGTKNSVVVLEHALWQRRFSGDRTIVEARSRSTARP